MKNRDLQAGLFVDKPITEELTIKYNLDPDFYKKNLDLALRSMKSETKKIQVNSNGVDTVFAVTRKGIGLIESGRSRTLWQYDFTINDEWSKYSVISSAELNEQTLKPIFDPSNEIIIRTDSGCETGQVFHDTTCDCKDQLHDAIKVISQKDRQGMIIHIPRQDGRGMGLPFKLATLVLQQRLGLNTIESAALISDNGLIDKRSYSGVIAILKFLGVTKDMNINFYSNNPHKREVFTANDFVISKKTNTKIAPNKHTKRHLEAKRDHLGHEIH
jgi:3,4-dihydroxy 2-butanone 4-phosphate synthase/GTP cyclohydrolase II